MPGQPFDRIDVLYNYLFHNTSKGHTVAVADILTNYRNHGYELEIKSFYRDKDVLNALDGRCKMSNRKEKERLTIKCQV